MSCLQSVIAPQEVGVCMTKSNTMPTEMDEVSVVKKNINTRG